MRYFGFFEGMQYGECKEIFEEYKAIKNQITKADILKYIKSLPIAAITPMTVTDIFTGQPLEQAGLIEDGGFSFPIDFIHYYENYDIGIPTDYEQHIKAKLYK